MRRPDQHGQLESGAAAGPGGAVRVVGSVGSRRFGRPIRAWARPVVPRNHGAGGRASRQSQGYAAPESPGS